MSRATLIAQDDRDDDAACGKIWEIYVKEAQQYDEGMVTSWKEDMDSMLVFVSGEATKRHQALEFNRQQSGLYSAILTAFVIESYQNLQPDLMENSTILLHRISEQLSSTSTLPPIPDPSSFTPTTAALACNILWFISLALALTCSFLATLVQQWSRRFLHRTSTVRSPGTHARLLQFLYFGLKDLRMHAIVDLIPSLLHLSLFLFFGGLIAFLHDVNNILLWILITTLSLVLLVYVVLTVLPILKLDSPYATPASSLLWRLLQIYRRFCAFISTPAIPSFIRRSWPVEAPRLAGLESIDEEAQTEHPSHYFMAEGHNKDGLSFTALEWSIVDATVKASRIRHIERESKSIVWVLRSLNDDFELLPFVEAVPEVIQYKEDSDTFREANLHLLEALVASADPQTNIILRILDLMESTPRNLHTKGHRERCSIACARALYALGHVVHANPVRFRPMTNNTPLFTLEIISRLRLGLCCGALDRAYGQSALVICALSSCLWIRDRLALEPHNSRDFAFLRRQAFALEKLTWRENIWKHSVKDSIPSERTQSQSPVDGAVSHLLFEYSLGAIGNYPQHFEYLSKLIVRESESAKHVFSHYGGQWILWRLSSALASGNFKKTDRDKVDAIIRVVIRNSGDGNTPDNLHSILPKCISSYHQTFGWGGRSILATPSILSKVLQSLRLAKDYLQPLKEFYATTLKHLLAYACDEEDYRFWFEIFRDIHQVSRDKSPQELSLSYLIALKLTFSGWSFKVLLVELQSLADNISDKTSTRKVYGHTSRGYLPWVTLLNCLASQLPISDTSDFLKFFHVEGLSYVNSLAMSNNGRFLAVFTHYSTEFYLKLKNCSKSELQPLLQVNGMVWAIWKVLALELSIDTMEICQAWSNVWSLLGMIEGAITSEICEVSTAATRQSHSAKNPSFAILLQKRRGGDYRQCIDLPANIEEAKNSLRQHRPLFARLPEADAEEDLHLATEDDTYSNRHPVNRDRFAAHYFVPLPPPQENEVLALHPPANDPTYLHMQQAEKAPDSGWRSDQISDTTSASAMNHSSYERGSGFVMLF